MPSEAEQIGFYDRVRSEYRYVSLGSSISERFRYDRGRVKVEPLTLRAEEAMTCLANIRRRRDGRRSRGLKTKRSGSFSKVSDDDDDHDELIFA